MRLYSISAVLSKCANVALAITHCGGVETSPDAQIYRSFNVLVQYEVSYCVLRDRVSDARTDVYTCTHEQMYEQTVSLLY